ncbi:hypothetical protein Tco_0388995 [Tanacetum coccineum]
MESNGAWMWPNAWLQKAPALGNVPTPILDNTRADVAQWRDINGDLKEFSVKNVWEAIRPRALHSGFHEAYKLHSPTNSTTNSPTTPPFTSTNELIHDCNPINTETHHHQTPLPPNAATIVSHKVKGLAGPRVKKQKKIRKPAKLYVVLLEFS